MDTKEVYDRQSRAVYHLAMTYLKNTADAEDAVHNVFVNYIKHKPEFKDSEHEKAWFIVATKNYCKNVLKNFWKSRVDMGNIPENNYEEKDEDSLLLDKIMGLPVKYREVLYLYYYEEYSIREISRLLSRNESTIQTQLAEARKKLKNILGKEKL